MYFVTYLFLIDMKQLAARVSVWCIEIERTVYTFKALFPCYFDDYYI